MKRQLLNYFQTTTSSHNMHVDECSHAADVVTVLRAMSRVTAHHPTCPRSPYGIRMRRLGFINCQRLNVEALVRHVRAASSGHWTVGSVQPTGSQWSMRTLVYVMNCRQVAAVHDERTQRTVTPEWRYAFLGTTAGVLSVNDVCVGYVRRKP